MSLLVACAGDAHQSCGDAGRSAGDEGCSPSAPTQVDSVRIGPDGVRTQDTLQATVVLAGTPIESGLGVDDAPVRYRWYVDGVEVAGTADHLHGWKYFQKDDEVQVLVEPLGGGEGVWSNIVSVANTPPPTPGITLYPERPIAGIDALRCAVSGVGDFDDDEILYRIDWTRDGSPWAARPPPPDDGGDSPGWDTGTLSSQPPPPPSEVPAGILRPGETWACHVSASDGTESSQTVTASVVVVEALGD